MKIKGEGKWALVPTNHVGTLILFPTRKDASEYKKNIKGKKEYVILPVIQKEPGNGR